MKTFITVITLFSILLVTASFTNQKNVSTQTPSVKKAKMVAKTKKAKKFKKTEPTETKIEIDSEYEQYLSDEKLDSESLAVATVKENPSKVHYFIKSKESPNLYEIQ